MPLYGTVVLSTSKINSIFGGLTHCGTRLEQIIDNRSTGKGLETHNFFFNFLFRCALQSRDLEMALASCSEHLQELECSVAIPRTADYLADSCDSTVLCC